MRCECSYTVQSAALLDWPAEQVKQKGRLTNQTPELLKARKKGDTGHIHRTQKGNVWCFVVRASRIISRCI